MLGRNAYAMSMSALFKPTDEQVISEFHAQSAHHSKEDIKVHGKHST